MVVSGRGFVKEKACSQRARADLVKTSKEEGTKITVETTDYGSTGRSANNKGK